jgi:hypothetical protein
MTDRPIRPVSGDPIAWPDRTFYLHVYYDGHKQLVFRSPRHDPPRESHSTRIDILFKGVQHVNVPATMSGLTIRLADAAARSASLAATSLEPDSTDSVFVVHGDRWTGFVVAVVAFTTEDEVEELYAPSGLTQDFRVRFNALDDPNTSYLKVVWHHQLTDEPVLLYSEVRGGREVRKIEMYRDGRADFADAHRATGTTLLSESHFPSIHEIAKQPQFTPLVIDRDEFNVVWESATRAGE